MAQKSPPLHTSTRQAISQIFQQLDYAALAPIYCDEGGEAFWNAHRGPCERLGAKLARQIKTQLLPQGKSLYVGAGVAEIPIMIMEMFELNRHIEAYNLRTEEVALLNQTCQAHGLDFQAADAQEAIGIFNHMWIVSVLNDPERFPELSALSYGRANPAAFDIRQFQQERESVFTLTEHCLKKLSIPGLVTTSVEEIPWISAWCEQQSLPYSIGDEDYPTAIVKDPICFIHVG